MIREGTLIEDYMKAILDACEGRTRPRQIVEAFCQTGLLFDDPDKNPDQFHPERLVSYTDQKMAGLLLRPQDSSETSNRWPGLKDGTSKSLILHPVNSRSDGCPPNPLGEVGVR